MSVKLVKFEFEQDSDRSAKVVLSIPQDEYEKLADRIADQILKNVDVKGFRKGKVPRKIAEKNVDPV